MNILLFDIGSYFQPDWVLVLERMGHHCRNVYYSFREQDVYHNEAFEALFEREWKEGDYDVVLSIWRRMTDMTIRPMPYSFLTGSSISSIKGRG